MLLAVHMSVAVHVFDLGVHVFDLGVHASQHDQSFQLVLLLMMHGVRVTEEMEVDRFPNAPNPSVYPRFAFTAGFRLLAPGGPRSN